MDNAITASNVVIDISSSKKKSPHSSPNTIIAMEQVKLQFKWNESNSGEIQTYVPELTDDEDEEDSVILSLNELIVQKKSNLRANEDFKKDNVNHKKGNFSLDKTTRKRTLEVDNDQMIQKSNIPPLSKRKALIYFQDIHEDSNDLKSKELYTELTGSVMDHGYINIYDFDNESVSERGLGLSSLDNLKVDSRRTTSMKSVWENIRKKLYKFFCFLLMIVLFSISICISYFTVTFMDYENNKPT